MAQVEESKTQIAETQEECAEWISEEIAVQIVETLKQKTVQAQTQSTDIKDKFQTVTREIRELC
jgi:hypothetical protein